MRLPDVVEQHKELFLQSMQPILDDAQKILEVESFWRKNDRRYYHIKGAMACFRDEYKESIPATIAVGSPPNDPFRHTTKQWLDRLLSTGESLGELRIASALLEREAPELWADMRDRAVKTREYLELYIGACIAVIQSSYDKTVNDQFYSQHDALIDMFRQYDAHVDAANESKIVAFFASHQPPALRRRLDGMVRKIGLVEHTLHGNTLYLPKECVPTVQSLSRRMDSGAAEALRIMRSGRLFYSETSAITLDGVQVDAGKDAVAGILRMTEIANEAKMTYANSLNEVVEKVGDAKLAKALFTDFSAYVQNYATARFFDKVSGGAFREVSAALEEVLVYHMASYHSFFDRRIEHALQVQQELGHDPSWVKHEHEGAKLLLRQAMADAKMIKPSTKGSYLLETADWARAPPAAVGVRAIAADPLLEGIDAGLLSPYRGSSSQ